jgi:hypothetical protein
MVYDKKENEGVKTKKSDANDKVNVTTQTFSMFACDDVVHIA